MTAVPEAGRMLPALSAPQGLLAWMATVDHKRIGILYLLTSLGYFLLGGLEALVMRTQLAMPTLALVNPFFYNQMFTVHGVTMIFFVIMPAGIGFANYVLPLMIGARDMVYPRLNALSYWLFLFGGLLFYYSFLHGGGPDAGWFAYPPLSVLPFSSGPAMDYWALGLLLSGIGSIAAAINLIVTTVALRAPGMTYGRLPVFVWTSVVTAFLILWAMPPFTAAAAMILLDRRLGAQFFLPDLGGSPILYQHLFWWLGHPEVYIMILPFFGVISEVVPIFARKPLFGYAFVVGSTLFIGFYSFLVWAHHMFTVGLTRFELGFFSAASFLIAVPTGVKVFSWLATLWGGVLRLNVAMLFALGFIVNFTIGGLTGVAVATVPFDWQVHDTYFIVAHLHYVLVGGSLLGIFAGAYYWFPKITGRLMSERLGVWQFWLTFIGLTLTFFPMHIMGFLGMARRVYTYPPGGGLGELNLVSSVGTYILAAAVLIFLYNLWWGARRGPHGGDNPWQGWTLEWTTPSPPPPENFPTIPVVNQRYPLWEEAGPAAPLRPPGAVAEPAHDSRMSGWERGR